MKSFVYHIELNVSDKEKSFQFYKDFLGHLGYKVTFEDNQALGLTNKTTDLWLIATQPRFKQNKYHRKNIGINHISFGVKSKEEVERFAKEFLKPRGLKPLYGSPREFPEYEKGYYAVYFEDPDRIKLEVTHNPGFTNW